MRICLSLFFIFFFLACSTEKKNHGYQAIHNNSTVEFEQTSFENILTKARNKNTMILIDFFAVW
jgi:hypothetical protein